MSVIQCFQGVNRDIKQVFDQRGGVLHSVKERWEQSQGVNRLVFSAIETLHAAFYGIPSQGSYANYNYSTKTITYSVGNSGYGEENKGGISITLGNLNKGDFIDFEHYGELTDVKGIFVGLSGSSWYQLLLKCNTTINGSKHLTIPTSGTYDLLVDAFGESKIPNSTINSGTIVNLKINGVEKGIQNISK